MRSVLTLLMTTLAAASALESPAVGPPGLACMGPDQPLVRVTAQQLSNRPMSYAFLVTNLTTVAISGIVVGRHETTMPILGVAANVPARMDAPPGWDKRHVHVEETRYMYYLWENKDPSKQIAPQQSAAGFRITLPEAGRDAGQVNFDRIPFEIALADGSCRWGLVGVDPLAR